MTTPSTPLRWPWVILQSAASGLPASSDHAVGALANTKGWQACAIMQQELPD
jgi:hypothetical protein